MAAEVASLNYVARIFHGKWNCTLDFAPKPDGSCRAELYLVLRRSRFI
jgi:hypothetical protein